MVVERFFRGSRQLRILFVTIAVLGFFPYSCRQDLCNPIFSLKLLLWDIFVQLFLIFGTYLQIVKVFLGLVTQDVGGWAFGFSLNLAAISQVLVSILMLIRSKKLVSMLKDLPAVLEELEEKERTLGFEVIDIVILVVIACVTAFSFLYFSLGGKLVAAEIIYLNICSLFGMSSIGCLLVLFRKLPRLLSQEIQRRVEDAVVACIENSVSDANTEGQEGDLAPLHALEQEVRKVFISLTKTHPISHTDTSAQTQHTNEQPQPPVNSNIPPPPYGNLKDSCWTTRKSKRRRATGKTHEYAFWSTFVFSCIPLRCFVFNCQIARHLLIFLKGTIAFPLAK